MVPPLSIHSRLRLFDNACAQRVHYVLPRDVALPHSQREMRVPENNLALRQDQPYMLFCLYCFKWLPKHCWHNANTFDDMQVQVFWVLGVGLPLRPRGSDEIFVLPISLRRRHIRMTLVEWSCVFGNLMSDSQQKSPTALSP